MRSVPADTRRWWVCTAVVVLVTAATLAVTLGRYVEEYRLHGDDFALVLNSSAAAVTELGVAPWFTSGYASYFDNYPDWTQVPTAFVRPLVNLQFLIAGLAEPTWGETAYLAANYLWVLLAAVAMLPILRRYTTVGAPAAAAVAVAVALSPVMHPALLSANMATNVLALMLCLFALAALDPRSTRPVAPRLARCAMLLTAATFAHETALVAALACAALLVAYTPTRPRVRELMWFALPFGAFVLSRLVLVEPRAVYATNLTLAGVILRLKHLAPGPMFPYYSLRFLEVRSMLTTAEVVVWGVLLLANALLVVALIRGLLDDRSTRRRRVGILIAWLVLVGLGVLMEGSPRFMGLSFVVALIGVLSLNDSRSWRAAIVGAVMVASVSMFWLQFVPARSADLASVRHSGAYADHLQERIATERPDTVLLVNDTVGMYGSRAMLELAAGSQEEVDVIVVNNLEGPSRGAGRFEVKAESKRIAITTGLREGQRAVFSGNYADFATSNAGLNYAGDLVADSVGGTLEVAGPLRPGRTLVLGIDPRDGSFLPGRIYRSAQ